MCKQIGNKILINFIIKKKRIQAEDLDTGHEKKYGPFRIRTQTKQGSVHKTIFIRVLFGIRKQLPVQLVISTHPPCDLMKPCTKPNST